MIKKSSEKGGIGGYHLLVFLELEADTYYKNGGIESVRQEGLKRLGSASRKLDKLGDDLKVYFKEQDRIKGLTPEQRQQEFNDLYLKQYGQKL